MVKRQIRVVLGIPVDDLFALRFTSQVLEQSAPDDFKDFVLQRVWVLAEANKTLLEAGQDLPLFRNWPPLQPRPASGFRTTRSVLGMASVSSWTKEMVWSLKLLSPSPAEAEMQ